MMKLHDGWLTGCFGSLFGGAGPEPNQFTAQSALFSWHTLVQQPNLFLQHPMRTLPPGIFWEQTGGKTHRVVIRRRPEVVIDLSNLGQSSIDTFCPGVLITGHDTGPTG
jgi:hypothetical protein